MPRTKLSCLSATAVVGLMASCIAPRPSSIELREEAAIVLKTVNLAHETPLYAAFAHHAWFDIRPDGVERWVRLEVDHKLVAREISASRALEDTRWGMPVRVLASWHGEEALSEISPLFDAARSQIDPTDTESRSALSDPIEDSEDEQGLGWQAHDWCLKYEAWPGPNSNTFISTLLEEVPGLRSELDHNSVGKDWTDGVRVGGTDGGLGVEIDTTYIGMAAGLRQGLELHLAGLTTGVTFWPPALKIPFLPRIGVHPGWVYSRW
jgi:hypothetical protein